MAVNPGPFLIVGAGGHGAAVAEVIVASGATIAGFVDAVKEQPPIDLDVPVLREAPGEHIASGRPFALAVGDNYQRYGLRANYLRRGLTDDYFPALIHPDASVSSFATLEPGAIVLQGANVGPGARIGSFSVVATGASAVHHAVMEDFSFVGPGAVLGAAVLGHRSFLGLAAVVHQGCTVGSDVVIGAQSYVRDDIPDATLAVGVPARVVRAREAGEPYLGRGA